MKNQGKAIPANTPRSYADLTDFGKAPWLLVELFDIEAAIIYGIVEYACRIKPFYFDDSLNEIAEKIKRSPDTVRRRLNLLTDSSWIVRESRAGKPPVYRLPEVNPIDTLTPSTVQGVLDSKQGTHSTVLGVPSRGQRGALAPREGSLERIGVKEVKKIKKQTKELKQPANQKLASGMIQCPKCGVAIFEEHEGQECIGHSTPGQFKN